MPLCIYFNHVRRVVRSRHSVLGAAESGPVCLSCCAYRTNHSCHPPLLRRASRRVRRIRRVPGTTAPSSGSTVDAGPAEPTPQAPTVPPLTNQGSPAIPAIADAHSPTRRGRTYDTNTCHPNTLADSPMSSNRIRTDTSAGGAGPTLTVDLRRLASGTVIQQVSRAPTRRATTRGPRACCDRDAARDGAFRCSRASFGRDVRYAGRGLGRVRKRSHACRSCRSGTPLPPGHVAASPGS